MNEDITGRLRMNRPCFEARDGNWREKDLASSLYEDAIKQTDSRVLSQDSMRRMAKQSIVAACVFWEEWDIAALTPDVSEPQQEF